jgi:hypothetical protein
MAGLNISHVGQNFMFLHKWLGLVIYIESTINTISWIVIEGKLYQPQRFV